MVQRYKRTSRKTGDKSREIKTHNLNTGATRVTRSVKLPGGVTHSSSILLGGNKDTKKRFRTTYTHNGGKYGYVTRRTVGAGQTKRAKSTRRRNSRSVGGELTGIAVVLLLLCAGVVYIFPSTLPYVLGFIAVCVGISLIMPYIHIIFWSGVLFGLFYLYLLVKDYLN